MYGSQQAWMVSAIAFWKNAQKFFRHHSLAVRCFSDGLETAPCQPRLKNKGSRSNPKNYRPITLLSCISKVFEGFVRDQLQSHCLLNDALPDEQFGFLPKRSAVWQLLSIVSEWEKALDNGIFTHTPAFWTWPRLLTELITPCLPWNFAV